ncbi:Bax inhibitor 1 [Coemansia spiralis]|nr:Bax inhibitor 1 [Coemansia spiralis]
MGRSTPPGKSTPVGSFSQTAQLAPRAQRQIANVYVTLAATVASAVVGHMSVNRLPVLGSFGLLLGVAGLALAAGVHLMPATPGNMLQRRGMLWGAGWSAGAVLHSAVAPMMRYGQADIVWMALGTAAALFASFAVAVMSSTRPQVIYATGVAAFAISSLSWVGLIGMLFPSSALMDMSLLLGLAVPGVSAVIHTRNMLDEAEAGVDIDPATYALRFFGNLVDMFVHLLAILRSNREREENNSRRRRPRARRDHDSSGPSFWQ